MCLFYHLFNLQKLLFRDDNFLAAHVRTQSFRDANAAVCLEVVLKECDEHTRRCNNGVVQRVGKVLAVFAVYADAQAARLCITKVGATADLKVLLLARGPRFNVHRLNFQVCEVAGAALERADRDIHAAEQVYGVLPELIIPLHGVFRLADDNHFLLFKLVDTVNAALLDAVCTFFPYGSTENSWSA